MRKVYFFYVNWTVTDYNFQLLFEFIRCTPPSTKLNLLLRYFPKLIGISSQCYSSQIDYNPLHTISLVWNFKFISNSPRKIIRYKITRYHFVSSKWNSDLQWLKFFRSLSEKSQMQFVSRGNLVEYTTD